MWGFNFVVIKVGVADMPPLFLTGVRYLFAAVPLVFFLPKPNVPWRHMIVYGMAMGFVQFGLLYPAIKLGLPAGLASLVMQSQAFSRWRSPWCFLASGRCPRRSSAQSLLSAGWRSLAWSG